MPFSFVLVPFDTWLAALVAVLADGKNSRLWLCDNRDPFFEFLARVASLTSPRLVDSRGDNNYGNSNTPGRGVVDGVGGRSQGVDRQEEIP